MGNYGFGFLGANRTGKRPGGECMDTGQQKMRTSRKNGDSLTDYAGRLAAGLERSGHERTARAYRSAAKRLAGFYGGRDVKPEHITAELMGDFQRSLKAEGKSMNTISFYMRTLRAIYNRAIAERLIVRRTENPFIGVYTGVSATRKLAFTSGELARLSEYDPTSPQRSGGARILPEHLQRALAMFLFCYHARGMCFVDMANLKKSDLRGDTILYRRCKTGQQIEVKVLPLMHRILDWFAPPTSDSDYLFPVISDRRKTPRMQYESGLRIQNRRLKKIAALAGIEKRISTNCARHSWATVARNEGLPLAVISEGLGHTNQKTTEIYLASLERSILDHASLIVSEAHRRLRVRSVAGISGVRFPLAVRQQAQIKRRNWFRPVSCKYDLNAFKQYLNGVCP